MKFSLLCFAFGALAATIETRDAATIAKDVQAVTDAVKDFDTTISSYSGKADNDKVKSKLDAVHSSLTKGASDAKASGMLAQDEALTLATPVQDLAKAVQKALTDLSSKKAALVSAGAGHDVYTKLTESDTAQKDFVTTVLGKVPPTLAPVATGIIKPAQDQLASVISDFKSAGSAPSGPAAESSAPAPAMAAPATGGGMSSSSAPAEAAAAPSASAPGGYAAPAPTSSSAVPESSAAPSMASNTTASAPTGTYTPAAYTGAAVPNAGKGSIAAIAMAMVAGLAF